jgi:hypothetical protein
MPRPGAGAGGGGGGRGRAPRPPPPPPPRGGGGGGGGGAGPARLQRQRAGHAEAEDEALGGRVAGGHAHREVVEAVRALVARQHRVHGRDLGLAQRRLPRAAPRFRP